MRRRRAGGGRREHYLLLQAVLRYGTASGKAAAGSVKIDGHRNRRLADVSSFGLASSELQGSAYQQGQVTGSPGDIAGEVRNRHRMTAVADRYRGLGQADHVKQ